MNQSQKRFEAGLARIVMASVHRACGFPRPGLWFNVTRIQTKGRPPSEIRVWAILHFTEAGSPFCCPEPLCHLGFSDRLDVVSEDVRRRLKLTQAVTVTFVNIDTELHGPLRFHFGQDDPEDEGY
jgi:hypothetical protein